MKTHIYIDPKKSNDIYCGGNKKHFNSAGIMITARESDYYDRNYCLKAVDFCKKCVKTYKSKKS